MSERESLRSVIKLLKFLIILVSLWLKVPYFLYILHYQVCLCIRTYVFRQHKYPDHRVKTVFPCVCVCVCVFQKREDSDDSED